MTRTRRGLPGRRALAAIAAALLLASGAAAAAHPLDPLGAAEIAAAVAALRAAGLADEGTRFPLIALDEPPKERVLAWQPGEPFARSAFVVARRGRTVYEGVVDLAARAVARWQAVPGAQTAILVEEWELAQRVTLADPGWRAAMRRRGYSDFGALFCAPLTVGHVAEPAEHGRRLLKVVCFDAAGGGANLWSRPIEGLVAVVDLDERKVIRLSDTGAVPVRRQAHDFAAAGDPVREAAARPPASRGFALAGNTVRWRNWSFHFRLDRRVGAILSLLRYDDRGRRRLVLYRGSVAEMFVPYMDPDPGWSFRTYMDVGEYGFGAPSSPLAPGVDCPADAEFPDAVLSDDRGAPVTLRSRICLFERGAAGPLWRHAELVNRTYAGRSGSELVLRTIPALGNYDYAIDWVLTETGALRIEVGVTGIDQVKGVVAGSMADPSAAADTRYGTLVAPGLAAVNHDHFISFRLDLDIDGPGNTLLRQDIVPQATDAEGGRRSLWRAVETEVAEEGPQPAAHGAGGSWRVVNPNTVNRLGQHPGYELRPGHSATSLLAPQDSAQRRAAFSAAPLWITAYDARELYAAGPYPNQSSGGDGLPAYAARRRPVANADIVLWYTMGFRHVPRPEDWPVLPTAWHGVALVPHGFFDRNPALDTPAEPPAAAGAK